MLTSHHTESLLTALSELHHIHDKQHLYLFVLNRCCDVLKAQAGTFFTINEEKGELIPEATKGTPLSLMREIPFKLKSGVSGWVATNQKPAMIENAQFDERFNRAVDVITGIKTRSLVCVPIVRQNRLLGVLELVNRIDGAFREADLEFVQHLSGQVSVAIENCNLYEESKHLIAYTTSVINSLTGGFISTDARGTVTRCNAAACRILSVIESDVIGKPLLVSLPQYPAFAAILDVSQKHQAPVQRQEIEIQKPDGSPLLIGYSTFLIRNEAQKILGAGILFQDLTNLQKK